MENINQYLKSRKWGVFNIIKILLGLVIIYYMISKIIIAATAGNLMYQDSWGIVFAVIVALLWITSGITLVLNGLEEKKIIEEVKEEVQEIVQDMIIKKPLIKKILSWKIWPYIYSILTLVATFGLFFIPSTRKQGFGALLFLFFIVTLTIVQIPLIIIGATIKNKIATNIFKVLLLIVSSLMLFVTVWSFI